MAGPARALPETAANRNGIAVFGGAFNPPHRTHGRLAREALQRLPIGELRVVPAGDHPHKRGGDMAPAGQRLAMCRLAFAAIPGVVVDDRELRRPGPSFTVDTLAAIAAECPGRPLFFLIGSDNLPLLPTWHQHHRLLSMCTVVTYARLGHPADESALAGLDLTAAERQSLLDHRLEFAADDVAASDLRARWRAGEHDLPELEPAVRDYLVEHDLYR